MFKRIRFSRKFVLISGGILLLGGASGVAAIVVGKERLFSENHASVNGLECQLVQTVNVKKNGAVWIRKFIRTEGGDGPDRIKTALRVAKAVYDTQKPDLVQISVLDHNGPSMRADMRGRAIAAQVVYIPDVAKLPDNAGAKTYSAFYYDGAASTDGVFYGLRIDLPLEDTVHLTAELKDFTDCADPAAEKAAQAHGSASKGNDAPSGGHGEAGGNDKPAVDHGDAAKEAPEAAPEASHEGPQDGEPSSPNANVVQDDPQLLTSTPEHDSVSIFSFAYIKSLVFGKGPSTAVAAEPVDKPVAEEPAAHVEEPAAAPADEPKPSH